MPGRPFPPPFLFFQPSSSLVVSHSRTDCLSRSGSGSLHPRNAFVAYSLPSRLCVLPGFMRGSVDPFEHLCKPNKRKDGVTPCPPPSLASLPPPLPPCHSRIGWALRSSQLHQSTQISTTRQTLSPTSQSTRALPPHQPTLDQDITTASAHQTARGSRTTTHSRLSLRRCSALPLHATATLCCTRRPTLISERTGRTSTGRGWAERTTERTTNETRSLPTLAKSHRG